MELPATNKRVHFPVGIQFKYTWRAYQQRVLDELDTHLTDDHLHVIAPPGSGKTVLGLEVALRLNKPTLILAPTIAIRDQWIQRFCELFLRSNTPPKWISDNIKAPAFLTVSTYQALHAACSSEKPLEELTLQKRAPGPSENGMLAMEELAEKLKEVGTIVVDEAHHLKNAWWESLDRIKRKLDPTIVGLTATPPYDVSPAEWQRYIGLNGPVDAEISVPELVAEENLCPHQDFVFFSQPTPLESQKIFAYRKRVQALFLELKEDPDLTEAIKGHPFFVNPGLHLDWIYGNLSYYSAMLIFLDSAGEQIAEIHKEVIGDKKLQLPELDFNWMAVLLDFYLFKEAETLSAFEVHRERLINKLRRAGALERKTISFWHSDKINRSLSSSLGKLDSIRQITDFEYNQLGDGLRMVILTDYIRREFLVNKPRHDLDLDKIGVMPIFEMLRRSHGGKIKMAVLTGSLIIIPQSAKEPMRSMAGALVESSLSFFPLPYDNGYLTVDASSHKHQLVHLITALFQQGHISLIVGTKALLGEGWDAPAINALIMASFVGSFVLSNQMRGRAIRRGKQDVNKTSNIWHLACLDPSDSEGGADIGLLRRRFKTFVGISSGKPPGIENGLGRMGIPEEITRFDEYEGLNETTLQQARARDRLQERWLDALEGGEELIEDIRIPFPRKQNYKQTKTLYYNRTIKSFVGLLVAAMGSFSIQAFFGIGKASRYIFNGVDLKNSLIGLGVVAIIIFGRMTFKAFRMYIKYRDIAKDANRIGEALLKSLLKAGIIHTDEAALRVVSRLDASGAIYCHLEGGSTFEKSVFIKSLQEVVELIDNPRYMIIRKSFFLRLIAQRDYHAVPEILGRNKKSAEIFKTMWQQLVGDCELIYTRSLEGRKRLLQSRINSLASEFEHQSERITLWK